ncbi:MAG: 5-oxoprolinase subunit PxpB [Proteobacteria bacterium]|nr:5-oxoprolinase subunit PxpB [Pseudomonadota bacterium]
MTSPAPKAGFLPCGDTALVVEFGDRVDRAVSDRVLRLQARVAKAKLPGVVEMVPTCRSLMVHYDPLRTGAAKLEHEIVPLLADGEAVASIGKSWRVPVCYEGDLAPDLDAVAKRVGRTTDEVIRLHSSVTYHVYMIGFLPGFPYMGDLVPELALPRLENPRLRVPPGSVAMAMRMTGAYPVASPGGWWLIGTTPIRLFEAGRARPSLFVPGDRAKFEPVAAREFAAIKRASDAGDYEVRSEELTS